MMHTLQAAYKRTASLNLAACTLRARLGLCGNDVAACGVVKLGGGASAGQPVCLNAGGNVCTLQHHRGVRAAPMSLRGLTAARGAERAAVEGALQAIILVQL